MQIGYAEGKCPKCGKTFRRHRPIDVAVCDCWEYCSEGHLMQDYAPDLSPSTYGSINDPNASGDLTHPIRIVKYCSTCNYYSAQLPVEVSLT